MKKVLAMLLAIAMIMSLLFLVGCGEDPADETTAASGTSDTTLALVVAGTFGDRSFYDSSKEGADRLAQDLGINVTYIECNNDSHTTQMQNAADKANIVVLVGWEFYEVETIAPNYPNVKFIWVDNATSEPIENVLCITYAQNEGSFLAGYIAAAMSKTGVVGAVGGEDSDTINDFIVGYEQGAQCYNEMFGTSVQVVKNYTNSYDDPATGKNCAIALNSQGADVIFQIASAAGDGVFEAAKEKGIYAIGVDSDQKYIDPEVIICSMKKEVGNSIYDAVKAMLDTETDFMSSTWLWVTDLSSGYVGIGYGEEGSTQQIPDEVKAAVEELAAKVISGEITVSTTR